MPRLIGRWYWPLASPEVRRATQRLRRYLGNVSARLSAMRARLRLRNFLLLQDERRLLRRAVRQRAAHVARLTWTHRLMMELHYLPRPAAWLGYVALKANCWGRLYIAAALLTLFVLPQLAVPLLIGGINPTAPGSGTGPWWTADLPVGGTGPDPFYDVLDYTGVGNGVAPDGTAINKAVLAIPASGGVLYLPATLIGIYRADVPVVVNKPNVTVQFGGSVLKAANGLNADLLQLTASNVFVLNGQLDGNKTNNASGTGVTINCSTPAGLVSGVHLLNTVVQKTSGFGIYVVATGAGGAVTGVGILDGCNVTDTNTGIFINGRQAAGGTVDITTVRDAIINTTFQHGVVSTGANRTIVDGSSFLNIGLNKAAGFSHGIAIDGNGGANPNSHHRVTDNWIINPADAGIEIADGITGASIVMNHVVHAGNGPNAVNTYGIYFGGALALSLDAEILGNDVTSCVGNGIQVTGPDGAHLTDHVSVLGNKVRLNGGSIIMTNVGPDIICRANPGANLVVDGQDFPIGDGAGNNALLTRQAGANSDALFRNTGTARVVLRPGDNSANDFAVDNAGNAAASGAVLPGNPGRGIVSRAQVFSGTGVPSNAQGNNGDFYFRTDTPATANQRLYTKSVGAWVGIL